MNVELKLADITYFGVNHLPKDNCKHTSEIFSKQGYTLKFDLEHSEIRSFLKRIPKEAIINCLDLKHFGKSPRFCCSSGWSDSHLEQKMSDAFFEKYPDLKPQEALETNLSPRNAPETALLDTTEQKQE